MTTLSAYGISLDLPVNWEGQIFKFDPDPDEPDELILPIVHAANFSYPVDQSSFGETTLSQSNGTGAFFAIVEYDASLISVGGFSQVGLPLPITTSQLDPLNLDIRSAVLTGYQIQFQQGNRAFVLQLAIGATGNLSSDLSDANGVLSTLTVVPPSAPGPGG